MPINPPDQTGPDWVAIIGLTVTIVVALAGIIWYLLGRVGTERMERERSDADIWQAMRSGEGDLHKKIDRVKDAAMPKEDALMHFKRIESTLAEMREENRQNAREERQHNEAIVRQFTEALEKMSARWGVNHFGKE